LNEWEPATEAEAAMRDALAATDQDSYFRILARSELLLPVSAEVLGGRAPVGWGTWTTGNRTHILAFTSPNALHLCLNEPTGSFRAVPFATLAAEWPNHEWWLAINPGLPIEAYLPSWFVAQLTQGGEVRLPGRTMGGARARMTQSDLTAALGARNRAAMAPGRATSADSPTPSAWATSHGTVPGPTGAMPPATGPAGAPTSSSGVNMFGPPAHPIPPGSPAIAASPSVNGRPQPVETVEAEIVDYPPVSGSARVVHPTGSPASPASGFSGPGYGGARGQETGYPPGQRDGYDRPTGYDRSTAYDRPTGYDRPAGYDSSTRPPGYDSSRPAGHDTSRPQEGPSPVPPGGFFRSSTEPRDLGARLRERFGESLGSSSRSRYGGATVDFATGGATGGFATGGATGGFAAAGAAGSGAASTYADSFVDSRTVAGYTEDEKTIRVVGIAPSSSSSMSPSRDDAIQDAEIVPATDAWAVGFAPANETESSLLAAAEENNTDAFLSTLLLARIVLPVPISMPPGSRPRDKYFPWQIEEMDGQRFIAVFTSPERMAEHGQSRFGPDVSSMSMRFIELIAAWPGEKISFAINPGSPVGATLPGSQIVGLAAWAAEVGLRDEPSTEVVVAPKKNEPVPSLGVAGAPTAGAAHATVMQRTVPPSQLAFYLERGYDRVSGFVNRASEVAHLTSPRSLYRALGLVHQGSPFSEDDAVAHVLRWVAHRADLYRLPYGGQHEAAMRAMQGWVIERAPFRGNGFAPGDTDVVAEFKVDSVRLPHGAQMWRLDSDGGETLIASFDADAGKWVDTP
jgi:hypothetical protein